MTQISDPRLHKDPDVLEVKTPKARLSHSEQALMKWMEEGHGLTDAELEEDPLSDDENAC